jgi:hypothetical protein
METWPSLAAQWSRENAWSSLKIKSYRKNDIVQAFRQKNRLEHIPNIEIVLGVVQPHPDLESVALLDPPEDVLHNDGDVGLVGMVMAGNRHALAGQSLKEISKYGREMGLDKYDSFANSKHLKLIESKC